MKKLVYNTVVAVPEVMNVVTTERVFQRYVLGELAIPDNPELPFILISELPAFVPSGVHDTSTALTHYFQIYMYDTVGSYQRIEDTLDAIVAGMKAMEGQTSPSGRTAMEVRWQTRSQDYADDSYKAFVKHDTFKITASSKH